MENSICKDKLYVVHSDYAKYQKKWQRIRDFYEGEDKVKEKGSLYLPILDKDDYENYIFRAQFLDATAETIDNFTAMMHRKPLVYNRIDQQDFSDIQNDILSNINLKGDSIDTVAKKITFEVISMSRFGVLIDYQRLDVNVRSRAEENIRPYLIEYKAEEIIDWNVKQVNGKTVLCYLKLCETMNNSNNYDNNIDYIIRECYLNENNQFEMKIYRSNDGGQTYNSDYETVIPTKNNQPLTTIPFFFFDTLENNWTVKKPMILPLVNLNHKHYLNGADFEWGLHFLGNPTPYITGYREDKKFLNQIGPSSLWKIGNEKAKVGMLEFSGQGMNAFDIEMKKKEGLMARFGVRTIGPENLIAATATEASIDNTARESKLASIANNISQQLSRVVEFMFEWFGEETEVEIKVNTDFVDVKMTPEMLNSLMDSVERGLLPLENFYANLIKGEIVTAKQTFEEYKDKLENTIPGSPAERPPIETEGNEE